MRYRGRHSRSTGASKCNRPVRSTRQARYFPTSERSLPHPTSSRRQQALCPDRQDAWSLPSREQAARTPPRSCARSAILRPSRCRDTSTLRRAARDNRFSAADRCTSFPREGCSIQRSPAPPLSRRFRDSQPLSARTRSCGNSLKTRRCRPHSSLSTSTQGRSSSVLKPGRRSRPPSCSRIRNFLPDILSR